MLPVIVSNGKLTILTAAILIIDSGAHANYNRT